MDSPYNLYNAEKTIPLDRLVDMRLPLVLCFMYGFRKSSSSKRRALDTGRYLRSSSFASCARVDAATREHIIIHIAIVAESGRAVLTQNGYAAQTLSRITHTGWTHRMRSSKSQVSKKASHL